MDALFTFVGKEYCFVVRFSGNNVVVCEIMNSWSFEVCYIVL